MCSHASDTTCQLIVSIHETYSTTAVVVLGLDLCLYVAGTAPVIWIQYRYCRTDFLVSVLYVVGTAPVIWIQYRYCRTDF